MLMRAKSEHLTNLHEDMPTLEHSSGPAIALSSWQMVEDLRSFKFYMKDPRILWLRQKAGGPDCWSSSTFT